MKISIALSCAMLALFLAGSADAATTYTYDALGRIVTATYDNGKQIVYSYDAAGNRTQVVTQTGSNQPPVAVADSASTNSNTAATIHVLTNDTDPDGDTLTVQSVSSSGTAGSPAITGSGTTITYTPLTNFSGTDSFGYTITDGHGHTASAPVTVTVANQPPVAVDDNASSTPAVPTVPKRTPTAIPVLANDHDPENDPLVITSVTAPSHGTAQITAGTITYTSIGTDTSNDSFTYTISDNHGNTAHATVTVPIDSTNTPPVAHYDELDLNSTGFPVVPQGQLDPRVNDTDADGDALTITSVGAATNGTVDIVSGGNAVRYVYNSTVTHLLVTTDSFTYTISDGHGGTATGTVTVYIDAEPNT